MKRIILIFSSLLLCLLLSCGCTDTSDGNEIPSEEKNTDVSNNTSGDEENLIATIYSPDIEAENLINKEVNLKNLTPQSLLDKLIDSEVITQNTTLINFDTYTEDDGSLVGVINFSEEFYDFNLGSSYESMMLNSVAKTYIKNFELDKFKILVKGENYESGHILFDEDDFFTQEDFN